jgi:hypothetical protein
VVKGQAVAIKLPLPNQSFVRLPLPIVEYNLAPLNLALILPIIQWQKNQAPPISVVALNVKQVVRQAVVLANLPALLPVQKTKLFVFLLPLMHKQ